MDKYEIMHELEQRVSQAVGYELDATTQNIHPLIDIVCGFGLDGSPTHYVLIKSAVDGEVFQKIIDNVAAFDSNKYGCTVYVIKSEIKHYDKTKRF
jgi:hypothetical protein|nr:MAG TPA: hypothetical protein [Caudoviricetes sp.]